MKKMLFVLLLALLVMPCTFLAQEETAAAAAPEGTQMQSAAPERSMSPERMQRREARMKRHDEMVAKKKEMDARLDEKVAAMDAAKGDQKVEAMAAVIKEMVAQRKSMQEQMMKRRHDRKGKHGRMRKGMEGQEGSGSKM